MRAAARSLHAILVAIALSVVLAGCQTTPTPKAGTAPPSEPAATSAPTIVAGTGRPPDAEPGASLARPERTEHVVPQAPMDVDASEDTSPSTHVSADDLFSRLVARLESPDCDGGELAARWRQRYAGSPQRFAATLEGILPVMAYVLEEVEAAGLPGEFALIPIVESWYRPDAIGPGGAIGLWQMLAGTATGNGAVIRPGYDGRLSVLDSTRSALTYLDTLVERFGDWRLASMAYNAGEYRIARALGRSGTSEGSGERRQPEGLANGTYEYVGKLKALGCLIAEADQRGIPLPREREVPRLATLDVPDGVHRLDTIAGVLGMPAVELRQLNAAHRQGVIAPGAPRELLVPLETAPRWPALADINEPVPAPRDGPSAASGRTHVVRAGENLWTIARQHRVRLQDLRSWNGLAENAVIRPGQRLRLSP